MSFVTSSTRSSALQPLTSLQPRTTPYIPLLPSRPFKVRTHAALSHVLMAAVVHTAQLEAAETLASAAEQNPRP